MSLALSSFPKLYVPFHYILQSCEYFDQRLAQAPFSTLADRCEQERVEKSLKLSSEGYSMSQEAAKLYEEAGAQHMSVTLLPFDPKVRCWRRCPASPTSEMWIRVWGPGFRTRFLRPAIFSMSSTYSCHRCDPGLSSDRRLNYIGSGCRYAWYRAATRLSVRADWVEWLEQSQQFAQSSGFPPIVM